MAKGLVERDNLAAIAGAIREKNGEETTYKPGEMAEAIRNLPSGGGGEYSNEVRITVPETAISNHKRLIDCSPYVDFQTDKCILISGDSYAGNWNGQVTFINGELDGHYAKDSTNHSASNARSVTWSWNNNYSGIDKSNSTVTHDDNSSTYGGSYAWYVILIY